MKPIFSSFGRLKKWESLLFVVLGMLLVFGLQAIAAEWGEAKTPRQVTDGDTLSAGDWNTVAQNITEVRAMLEGLHFGDTIGEVSVKEYVDTMIAAADNGGLCGMVTILEAAGYAPTIAQDSQYGCIAPLTSEEVANGQNIFFENNCGIFLQSVEQNCQVSTNPCPQGQELEITRKQYLCWNEGSLDIWNMENDIKNGNIPDSIVQICEQIAL